MTICSFYFTFYVYELKINRGPFGNDSAVRVWRGPRAKRPRHLCDATRYVFLVLLPESRSRDDKELQLSDLDDFDAIESESSECDVKHQFHVSAHVNALPEHLKETSLKLPSLEGEALKLPSIRTTLERDADLPKSCVKTASVRDCELIPNGNTKLCFQQDHQALDSKPRIWSLAQTATSLNPTEYSSCMLRCHPAAPGSSSPPAKVSEKQQDSPVTTLRHWMDGVFHDPLFRHSTLDQAHNSNTAVSWSTTKGSILESGVQRDWPAHVISTKNKTYTLYIFRNTLHKLPAWNTSTLCGLDTHKKKTFGHFYA